MVEQVVSWWGVCIIVITTGVLGLVVRDLLAYRHGRWIALTVLFVSTAPVVWSGVPLNVSDSVEYLISASAWSENGSFVLPLGGAEYPSRYPPWMAVGMLAPFLNLFGAETAGEVSNAAMAFQIFARATLFLPAAAVLLSTSGVGGALLGLGIITVLPGFYYFALEPLPDLLLAGFVMLGLYFAFRKGPSSSFVAVMVSSVLTAVKLPGALLVVAFLRSGWKGAVGATALTLGITLWYQVESFGSPMTTGYHLWIPELYGGGEEFSSAYLLRNAAVLLIESGLLFLMGALVMIWLVRRRERLLLRPDERDLLFFVAALLPFLALHLLYFWSSIRFVLPVVVPMTVTVLVVGAPFLKRPWLLSVVGVVLIGAASTRASQGMPLVVRAPLSGEISSEERVVAEDNPLLVEWFIARGRGLTVIPQDRTREYASKRVPGDTSRWIYPEVTQD